eukprot:scaffold5846_cov134-Pinguiococcus_pyrenoidosus.AAC.1
MVLDVRCVLNWGLVVGPDAEVWILVVGGRVMLCAGMLFEWPNQDRNFARYVRGGGQSAFPME